VSLEDVLLLAFENRAQVKQHAVTFEAGDDRRAVFSEQGCEFSRATVGMGYGNQLGGNRLAGGRAAADHRLTVFEFDLEPGEGSDTSRQACGAGGDFLFLHVNHAQGWHRTQVDTSRWWPPTRRW